MTQKELLLGNVAIARGLVEEGTSVACAYPGTPSSEILPAVAAYFIADSVEDASAQWAINEKVAFEIAYTASITGLRSAVMMKQVGLNVAADSLMSAVYMGEKGGFIVISADDPGPHSSQTEQDSRLMGFLARMPVLDPATPQEAKDCIKIAYDISEKFEIPVMVRPTTRVCHSRQDVEINSKEVGQRFPNFEKTPGRWTATPKFRRQLHAQLEEKNNQIAQYDATKPVCHIQANTKKAIVASGVVCAHAMEILQDPEFHNLSSFYQVIQAVPLHSDFTLMLIEIYDEILVLEETMGVIEMQMACRRKVNGKQNGTVPSVGELTPEKIETVLRKFLNLPEKSVSSEKPAGRRPTLCAGCPHRASFYGIKKAAPNGIYTSDIGCYTLGMNLGAVDTFICMGGSIGQAIGMTRAYEHTENPPTVVATIGDSTFFHSGTAPLIEAVVQKSPIVLVILDNRTTAMTGHQPTPATGHSAMGEALASVDLERLVNGCGVNDIVPLDPYDLPNFIAEMKKAVAVAKGNGPVVVISRHECLLDKTHPKTAPVSPVEITDRCNACGICIDQFECPALIPAPTKEDRTTVDRLLCVGCGVCISVCPRGAIEASEGGAS